MALFAQASNLANSHSRCSSLFVDSRRNWDFSERRLRWTEQGIDGKEKFYATAYVTDLGMLYLNLKLVTEDGSERASINGMKFVEKALAHFRNNGVHVSGIKGWWNFSHEHGPNAASLYNQVKESGLESVNFKNYLLNRKKPDDVDAVKKTWTYKMASHFGFSVVAKVSEFKPQKNYSTVMVTFLPLVVDNSTVRKKLFGDKNEIEVVLPETFLPHDSLIGSEEPTQLGLRTIFKLNISQSMLIDIFIQNSQTVSDLHLLGFKILAIENRIVYNDDGKSSKTEIVVRIRP